MNHNHHNGIEIPGEELGIQNSTFERVFKKARGVTLTSEEKNRVRDRLIIFIQEHPLPEKGTLQSLGERNDRIPF